MLVILFSIWKYPIFYAGYDKWVYAIYVWNIPKGQRPNVTIFNDFSENHRVDGRNFHTTIGHEVLNCLESIGIYFAFMKLPDKIIQGCQIPRSWGRNWCQKLCNPQTFRLTKLAGRVDLFFCIFKKEWNKYASTY